MAEYKAKKCPECGFNIISYKRGGKWYLETHTLPGTVQERKGTNCPGSTKEVK
jgi:hypothetical protein